MALIETWLQSDLKKPIVVKQLTGNLFSADNGANLIGVEILDNGSAASVSGGVMGYVIREDGATVTVSGTLSNNKASIVLPASAYTVVGHISIVIKVGTTTVGACTSYVYRTTTDTLVDPGHVIPSIEELLAKIADCEAATQAATSATLAAISATAIANEKIEIINSAIIASSSSTAAANTAALSAVSATAGANAATLSANSAAYKIDGMTASINAGDPSLNPTVSLTLVDGHYVLTFSNMKGAKGDTGEAFHIVKTYASISDMNADYSGTDVKVGEYVMIVSTVEDPDNAKVYIKGSSAYSFVVDMSGATGIQGQNAYVHIRYAATEPTQDSDIKTTPDAWIGIYSGTSSTAPTTYSSYTWYKFKGTDGTNGNDGTNAYVHIKWAAAEPTQDSDMKDSPDAWIGIYSGTSSSAPTTYTSYTWSKFEGTDGTNGTSAYVHIKYSAVEPTQDSDMKSTPDEWMGIYSGSSSSAPTTYTSYTWYKIKGENGAGTIAAIKLNGATLAISSGVVDLGSLKTVQSSVSDPSASGDSVTFIDSITQDTNGVITPTKKTVKTYMGATSSAAGSAGLAPAPSAGDQLKVLTGGGTWEVSPGAKKFAVTLTAITNNNGSYSGTTYDERIGTDMVCDRLEISNPEAFRCKPVITITDGAITLTGTNIVGSTTVKAWLQKVIADPTEMTSTEFTILNNRLLAVENVCTEHSVTILATDWSSSSPYTYEWTNSLVTSSCSVEVELRDGAGAAEIETLEWAKTTGKVTFTTEEVAAASLPITIRIINAKTDTFQSLSADEISSEAITGCDTVEEAITNLDGRASTIADQIGNIHGLTIERGQRSGGSTITVDVTGCYMVRITCLRAPSQSYGIWCWEGIGNAIRAMVESYGYNISLSGSTITISDTVGSAFSFVCELFK